MIITDSSDSENLSARSFGSRRQQIGIGIEDLLLVAELQPRIY